MSKVKETRIENLMTTKLVTVGYSEPLEAALTLFREHRIRHLPVVDSIGQVVGILSDRDLLRASVPIPFEANRDLTLRFISGAVVLDYMSTALKVVSAGGDVSVAIDMMLKEKVSSCLVTTGDEVVGVVTYEDLMCVLKDYVNKPSGNLRSSIGSMIARSPLGAISNVLANNGI